MAYCGKCKICFVRLYDRDDDHENNICGRCKNGGLSQKARHLAVNQEIEGALPEDHPKTEMQKGSPAGADVRQMVVADTQFLMLPSSSSRKVDSQLTKKGA